MLRNIEAIRKGHRDEARGWGRTRTERERKKAEKGASTQLDERLVLDDQGIVCIAEDYDGDIEEGMARYEKALGMGTPRPRRAVANDGTPPVVPDFARWVPPAKPCGAEDGVPLSRAGDGERANLQNEKSEGGRVVGNGSEPSFGQGDGAAGEPHLADGDSGKRASCKAEDGVPLMITDEGERTNRQNETSEPVVVSECREAGQEADSGSAIEGPKLGLSDQAGGGCKPSQRFKREKKRMREEMTKRELERRAGRKRDTASPTDLEKIKSIEWLLPNMAKVLRKHYSGPP
jgi:hypothetical protein